MLWKGIGVLATIVVLGAVAGRVASAGDARPATRSVRVGALTLVLDPAWRRVDATTFSNRLQSMRVTLGRADAPALAQGARKAARLGGYRAWSYGRVTVLPTTRGVLTVECDCANAIRAVSVAGGAVLAPASDIPLRLRAPGVLAALDATRVKERGAWTDTSARRLAAAHRAALDALRPIAPASLTRALSGAAVAYDGLARTGATGADAALDDVAAADRTLEGVVAALAREGAPKVQRPPAATAAAPGGGGASLPVLLMVLVFALGVSVLGPAGLRRLRRHRAGSPSPVTAGDDGQSEACRLTADRRKPIAPPPTFGRWNEPPRGQGAARRDDARDTAGASSSTS